jgi:hypothetical protein
MHVLCADNLAAYCFLNQQMDQQRRLLEQYNKNRMQKSLVAESAFKTGLEAAVEQEQHQGPQLGHGTTESSSSASKRPRFQLSSPADSLEEPVAADDGNETDDSLDEILNFTPFGKKA